jgi:hypothetical protein
MTPRPSRSSLRSALALLLDAADAAEAGVLHKQAFETSLTFNGRLDANAREIGTGGAAGSSGTYATVRSCDLVFHLYCFEQ